MFPLVLSLLRATVLLNDLRLLLALLSCLSANAPSVPFSPFSLLAPPRCTRGMELYGFALKQESRDCKLLRLCFYALSKRSCLVLF